MAIRDAKRASAALVPRPIEGISVQLTSPDSTLTPSSRNKSPSKRTTSASTPAPSTEASAGNDDFERKLLAAMAQAEAGENPFLDKRKALMRDEARKSMAAANIRHDEEEEPVMAMINTTATSTSPQIRSAAHSPEATPRVKTAIELPRLDQLAQSDLAIQQSSTRIGPSSLSDLHRSPPTETAAPHDSPKATVHVEPVTGHSSASAHPSLASSAIPSATVEPHLTRRQASYEDLELRYQQSQAELEKTREDVQGWQSEATRLEEEMAASQAQQGQAQDDETELLRDKYNLLKQQYAELKLSKDEAIWQALTSVETGLEATRRLQVEASCTRAELIHERIIKNDLAWRLDRAVRIAKTRGSRLAAAAKATAAAAPPTPQPRPSISASQKEVERERRLRLELETKVADLKAELRTAKATTSTQSISGARRLAPMAKASSPAPASSSQMAIEEDDEDDELAQPAPPRSSRPVASSSSKTKISSPIRKPAASVGETTASLRERVLARAAPQPRKRPAIETADESSSTAALEEEDDDESSEEVTEDMIVVKKPAASTVKKAASVTTSKAPTTALKTTAVKKSVPASITSTKPTPALAPAKQTVTKTSTTSTKPVAAKPIVKPVSKQAVSASLAPETPILSTAAAQQKKKRRLLGNVNPITYPSSGAAKSNGNEETQAENLLNPQFEIPINLSPIKGTAGGAGVSKGRFGLGSGGAAGGPKGGRGIFG